MWANLLKIRNLYLQGRKFLVGNGKKILFWKDRWLYDKPLDILFPDLFKMAQHQDISLAEAKMNPDKITFSRWLVDQWQKQWEHITSELSKISLNDSDDIVLWRFGKKCHFSVKSMYDMLTVNDSGSYFKKIWKSKIPNKIKIFMWLVVNDAILTKDNMIRRKWQGDPKCSFCSMNESAPHLLFQCNIARAVWAIFATCMGASDIPNYINQCWTWCEKWLPGGENSTLWVLWLFADLSRKQEKKSVSKGKW
jgi:hypothetical protein